MIRRSKRNHEIPALNTSSLPDLIFTVLFFFMIVTHMRNVTVKVRYQVPQGKELTASIKADKDTKMKTIAEVKQALREAKVYNVNFTATQNKNKR